MTITRAQKRRRKTAIGSSDMPAILGFDPWNNSRGVWIEKMRELEEEAEDLLSPKTMGDDVEPMMVGWAARELGVRVRKNVARRNGIFLCHLDAQIVGEDRLIEAKYTGVEAGWGETSLEAPTDAVPPRVVIQVHHQMICSDNVEGLVAVMMPGRKNWFTDSLTGELVSSQQLERRLYLVEKDAELANYIWDAGNEWWEKYYLPRNEPVHQPLPPMEIMERIIRQPGSWAEVPDDLIRDYDNSSKVLSLAKKEQASAKQALVAAMGDTEGARAAEDMTLPEITYFSNKGRVSFGEGNKYQDPCGTCGVGYKRGKDYRKIGRRKRTDG